MEYEIFTKYSSRYIHYSILGNNLIFWNKLIKIKK